MQDTKQQKRLKNIIQYINNNPDCTTHDIVDKTGSKIRTIQKDLEYLREHWKDGKIYSKRGVHRVEISKTYSQKALEEEKRIFLKLSLESLKDLSDLSRHCTTLHEEFNLNTLTTPYFVKAERYQTLKTHQEHKDDIDDLRNLSEAIKKDHVVEFKFRGRYYHVEPFRLVNFDGIWYLYGRDKEESEENDHKTWMLKDIDKVEVYYGDTHDTPDEEIDEDLENAHSAEFVPDRSFEVKLKVSETVADKFRQLNHLPNQNSTIQEDGSLLVTSTISTYADIDPEVKSWLPHIEILEPSEYRERFREELAVYLTSLD